MAKLTTKIIISTQSLAFNLSRIIPAVGIGCEKKSCQYEQPNDVFGAEDVALFL